jgi:hypothetical protein
MDLEPAPVSQASDKDVVGIDNNHGADIDVEPVPKTSFGDIVTRGGNNPDGKFTLLIS